MSPAHCNPPVPVVTASGLERLTDLRVCELRAKGIPYEVVQAAEVLGEKNDLPPIQVFSTGVSDEDLRRQLEALDALDIPYELVSVDDVLDAWNVWW